MGRTPFTRPGSSSSLALSALRWISFPFWMAEGTSKLDVQQCVQTPQSHARAPCRQDCRQRSPRACLEHCSLQVSPRGGEPTRSSFGSGTHKLCSKFCLSTNACATTVAWVSRGKELCIVHWSNPTNSLFQWIHMCSPEAVSGNRCFYYVQMVQV